MIQTLPQKKKEIEKLQTIGMRLGSIYSSYLEAKELNGSCPPLDYRPLNGVPPFGRPRAPEHLSDIMPGK
jgi:hypothetical protein